MLISPCFDMRDTCISPKPAKKPEGSGDDSKKLRRIIEYVNVNRDYLAFAIISRFLQLKASQDTSDKGHP